jgi:hypothetical protein
MYGVDCQRPHHPAVDVHDDLLGDLLLSELVVDGEVDRGRRGGGGLLHHLICIGRLEACGDRPGAPGEADTQEEHARNGRHDPRDLSDTRDLELPQFEATTDDGDEQEQDPEEEGKQLWGHFDFTSSC